MNVDEWSNWFALVRYNKTEKSFPKRRPIDHTATPLTYGTPRRASIMSIPIFQLLVSIEVTTSKGTALVVRQVKKNPQRFSVDLLTTTWNGPK